MPPAYVLQWTTTNRSYGTQIFVGWAADVFGTFNVFFVSVFLGGVLQLVCWLFAENFASIIVFAIVSTPSSFPTLPLLTLLSALGHLRGLLPHPPPRDVRRDVGH